MKSFAIVFVVITMLVIAFSAPVFPQKKENLRHGKMFIQEKMMEVERGLRPHLPGSQNEELFQDEQILRSSRQFDRRGVQLSKILSYSMYVLISDVLEEWDIIASVWRASSKSTYAYDANGNRKEHLIQDWDGSAWVNDDKYTYAYDANGNRTEHLFQTWGGSAWVNSLKGTFTWQMLITDVNEQVNAIGSFTLSANYPNPFNPQTKISISVPKESYITLKVYDLLGKEVTTLVNEKKRPGEYSITWSAESVPSGMYFYRLVAEDFVETKKIILMK
ncbi:MAG: T9SS type A sorting domain-containing protein [Bacteroidota bacterium]|nr:T9SS type A sorting domain-containing protein [Bacteroidota bacterium]